MKVDDLSSDYHAAVVHLVWDVHRKNKDRTLLCGAVELLPLEVPAPLEVAERCCTLSDEHFLYASDRVLPLAAALDWYEQAKAGSAPRPNRAGALIAQGSDKFVSMAVDEEPEAPTFCLPARSVPFAAGWHCCSRTRHLIARTFRIDQLWTDAELAAACDWLKREVHFDFTHTPEFWGSIHLIAPNPVFRELGGDFDRTKVPRELVIRPTYRLGIEPRDLQFELEGTGPVGHVFTLRRQLGRGTTQIPLPCDPGEYHERVIDPKRGLIYELGPFSVSTTVNLVTSTRHVSVPLADGSSGDFEVPLVGSLRQSMITGESTQDTNAVQRLREASRSRRQRQAGNGGQRWFRDQVPDATKALRDLVGRATKRIWVADPYFSPEDILRVLAASRDPQVPILVLAGGDHLRSHAAGAELGDALEATLSACATQGRMNPVTIRVMRGSPPPLHDRLLLADDALWMLGSSLNAFGSRGTMLLKVPDPDPVLVDVQRMWDDAEEFADWLVTRRATRAASQSDGDDE